VDEMNEVMLFDMLQDEYYPDLVMMSNDFSNFDCVSEREDIFVELKCRKTHYDNLMIEKYKYDNIKAQADMTGKIAIYICSTPEGIWEFNLDTFKISWEDRADLPATTEFDNQTRIVKRVGYLPISKGKRLFPYYPAFGSYDEMYDDGSSDSIDMWEEVG